ncbi:serine/threonine-protein kinase EDR1 isoform X2 [Argentina anserina]|uniref:serine/threonine-protein kinase EDR1 isoform X2 n=1 Tax=Argentina anserina TaxID=57926 RepID=UPI0021765CCB|nr:serine/threonine-protein kinase EDR1 isoform X2 [Potentilla anserina]
MSKMKHLLRKLHIGGGLNEHQRLPETAAAASAPSPVANLNRTASSPASSSSGSATMGRIAAAVESMSDRASGDGGGSGGGGGGVDFNFLEEEFQVQLALAISASDPDSRDDPETAQINAAKRISLGCAATSSRADAQAPFQMLSLRYWSHNVVDYNEKVVDGFYDVYGITSDSFRQGKMPLLEEFKAVSVSDNVDYDVIVVNRSVDAELQQLENRAYTASLESGISQHGLLLSGLIQKIADIVVDRMGGPVGDADEILRRWKVRRHELRSSMNTIILPLGLIDVGLSRHRALLFKVLADKINLPCMLVKGSYYTGTDDGAVNLIKIDGGIGSEYIIDLMGAPGTLIPAEVPTSQLPNSFFAIRSFQDPTEMPTEIPKDMYLLQAEGTGTLAAPPGLKRAATFGSSRSEEASYAGGHTKDDQRSVTEENQIEILKSDLEVPPKSKSCESSSGASGKATSAQKRKVKNVSKYVISAAKNPEFAQKLHAVLLESGASPPPDLFSDMNPQYLNEEQRNQWQTNSIPSDNVDESFVMVSGRNSERTQIGAIDPDHALGNPPRMNLEAFYQEKINDLSMISGTTSANTQFGKESVAQSTETANSRLCAAWDSHVDRYPPLGEVAEWEILWEDLQIGERIGIGSYGEVYHADWNGTEVAVKKFLDQDFSGDALVQFRCEVEIMLRLRHPNVVLFMGAVTRPPHFSILTEFLPRGSLYRLLHRPNSQLDERRRMRMAHDVAKGMNYLHTSNPTVVHRDLKSPNLLVDKNWNVKVCDFGLSRTKHHTYLSSKSTAGTPEWMAPEVLRNERANEKCDVYSFGVILWELTTCSIPWKGLNPMQVVGAVGFQNRRLEIPDDVDPMVAEIIRDCWHTEPNLRPSFSQLMVRLKRLQQLVGRTNSANQVTQ